MDLDLEKVKQLSVEQIYNLILPNINKLKDAFKCLNLSDEEFYRLVIEKIKDSKNTYLGNENYESFINEKIELELIKKVCVFINEKDSVVDLLNSYINQEFTDVSSYDEVMSCFTKLIKLFEKCNFVPTIDLIMNLLRENVLFNRAVEVVFKVYQTKTNLEKKKIFDNDLMAMAIDSYCMLHNVQNVHFNGISYDEKEELPSDITMYLNEIKGIPVLSIEEEKALVRKASDGDKRAKNMLVERNLKFVALIAKKFVGRGLDYLDLVQEGNMGLIFSIDKFDPDKGYRFLTYATSWIKHYISDAISRKGNGIIFPYNAYFAIFKYKKIVLKAQMNNKRVPKMSEVTDRLGISLQMAKNLELINYDLSSLNDTVLDDEGTELGDLIASNDDSPDDLVVNESIKSEIEKLFNDSSLSERERTILKLRFGVANPVARTVIGNKYNITGERVRTIELAALNKIIVSGLADDLVIYTQNPTEAKKTIQRIKDERTSTIEAKQHVRAIRKSRLRFTIYTIFNGYTTSQVSKILKLLSKDEIAVVNKMYGDSDEQVITKSENNLFHDVILPKMSRFLKCLDINQQEQSLEQLTKYLSNDTNCDVLEKEEYIKILNLINSKAFEILLNYFTFKESFALLLLLNFEDNSFVYNLLSKYYHMRQSVIRVMFNRILEDYKNIVSCEDKNIIENNRGYVRFISKDNK